MAPGASPPNSISPWKRQTVTSLALGRFLLDGSHVVGCRYAYADAWLAAQLKAGGLDARLYAGKNEGRVLDLGRQFARMRADAYLWAVDEHSLAVSMQVARQLAMLKPAARLLFQGDISDALWRACAWPAELQAQRLPQDAEAALRA